MFESSTHMAMLNPKGYGEVEEASPTILIYFPRLLISGFQVSKTHFIPLLPLVDQMVKESACNAGDPGLILGLERSPGEGDGYPLQYSCPENSMDRGAWWPTVLGVAKSQTRLSD